MSAPTTLDGGVVSEQREYPRERLIAMLQEIIRNDETQFKHHQPRRWDGQKPSSKGGTIWLTPREMARQALRFIGAEIPDALAELRREVTGSSSPNYGATGTATLAEVAPDCE